MQVDKPGKTRVGIDDRPCFENLPPVSLLLSHKEDTDCPDIKDRIADVVLEFFSYLQQGIGNQNRIARDVLCDGGGN